jgi:hypothetical protein
MNDGLPRFVYSRGALVVFLTVACSQPQPVEPRTRVLPPASTSPSALAAPAPFERQPVPTLPSGALEPIEHQEPIQGVVSAAERTGDTQTFLITLPQSLLPVDDPVTTVVNLQGEGQLLSVVGVNPSGNIDIWLRRKVRATEAAAQPSNTTPQTREPTRVDVFTSALALAEQSVARPGHHYQIVVELPEVTKSDAKLFQRYLHAVASAAPAGAPARWLLDPTLRVAAPQPGATSAELTEWMRLTSGYDSIEAALATSPSLSQAVDPRVATVALQKLGAPELRRHPWVAMLKAIPSTGPKERLASLLPSNFYFVRARSFNAFQSLLSQVDELVSPILGTTAQRREVLDLSERYRLELGLPEGELARLLGPELISELALVGSDPLLRQGSDVSILMAVPNASTLLGTLAVRRAALSQRLTLAAASWTYAGVEVKSYTSPLGEVHQHLAAHTAPDGQQYVLVSNSPNATKRIIDVWVGKAPKLAEALDFQYMLARDAGVADDVLAYMSDEFVGQVVSPRTRILELRRQVAKSELSRVGYTALLQAQLLGQLPADMPEMTSAKWATVSPRHTTGESITYTPTRGPRSSWGGVARLTSIIDLPTPTRVSKIEQEAYVSFVQSYEQRWGENIDPIALRIQTKPGAIDAHVRVLPVANIGDYSEIAQFSGGGSTKRQASIHALAAILAIGEQSELRSLLGRQGESFLGDRLKLDWLGDWVEVGLADDNLLAKTALTYGDFPQPPSATAHGPDSDLSTLGKLPLYVMIDLKSAAGAALLLTKLRELALEAAPDVVRWGTLETAGRETIVRVTFDDVVLYYSLTKDRFVLSPHLPTLKRLLGRELEPPEQTNPTKAADGGQLVVDLRPRADQSALRAVGAWLAELGVREMGVYDPFADLLLRALPSTSADDGAYQTLAFSHLGGIPVTADGKLYQRATSGLLDPERGTAHAPRWPRVPVAGSTVEHILRTLRRLRTEVSIDREPGSPEITSLRTRIVVEH